MKLITVERDPYVFRGAHWDGVARGVVLAWTADTGLGNLLLMRMVVVGASWPPVRWMSRMADLEKEVFYECTRVG